MTSPSDYEKSVVDAVFRYLYNRSNLAIVLDVFRAEERTLDDLVPEYVAEKVERLDRSACDFYGGLDDGNQRRFVELALGFETGHATSQAKIIEYARASTRSGQK